MKAKTLTLALFIGWMGFSTMGCASHRTVAQSPDVVVVKKRPPALRLEKRTVRPSGTHVWITGHWTWKRGAYRWQKGHWAKPPNRRAVWVPAHWKKQKGGWVYVKGSWRTAR